MTILFAGGESDSFTYPNGYPGSSGSSASYDSAFCRGSMIGLPDQPCVATLVSPSQSEVWFHAEIYRLNNSGTQFMLQLQNAAGQRVVSISNNGTTLTLQRWNGSADVSTGTATWASGQKYQWDLYLKIADVGGVIEWYVNGVLVASYYGDTNLFASAEVSKVWLGGTYPAQPSLSSFWSQVIVATTDTRSMKLATLSPNANGDIDQWTGSYANINSFNYNDSSYISSGTANQVELMGLTDLSPTAATLDVIAFVMSSRGRRGATGPQNVQATLRTGGNDFFSGNLSGIAPVFGTLGQVIWETNPNTALPWSVAEINALQAGFKSVA